MVTSQLQWPARASTQLVRGWLTSVHCVCASLLFCSDEAMLKRFDVPVVTGGAAVFHQPVHIADAFDYAETYHLKRSRCAVGEKQLEATFASMADYVPLTFRSCNEKQSFEVDQQQLEWVLEHGFDATLVEVGEIRDMRSPIRIANLPNQKPFGVFAKKAISAGTILYTVRCARSCSWASVSSMQKKRASTL